MSIPEVGVNIVQTVTLSPSSPNLITFSPLVYPTLTMTNPPLWWPARMGPQTLLNLTAWFTIQGGSASSDVYAARIGLREVRAVLTLLPTAVIA